ncbi:DUF3782 domain-containing protein [Phormidium sp. FACHB-1136]|uniref:DUF3782 domain-containing protein n=1 Tax=Phormidium sp. FACHB-1136 TaxID=2692848 RepID=UPI001684DDAA|nr:DUF3782 domain-containing protein [Phormidium sp. FACHB-1136]MBD2424704.1 DUF3782 domain-containing protein [Phormidium sp. FACHB-1136]
MTTTADDVWRLLAELAEAQKETKQMFQETDRRFQETDRRFQETDRKFQESDRKIQESRQELGRVIAETRRDMAESNRQLNQQLGALGGKWGLFVENMVAPACKTLFLDRGIPVHRVSQRVQVIRDGDTMEVDVLVQNQNHVLAVEVKSSLSVDDIKEFVEDLQRFHQFFPEHADRQLYGAVAGIAFDQGADRYAYRQGLFVLAQSGETMQILNDASFEPKAW